MMQDYAVKVSVRNGRILSRMEECGIETQSELAKRAGVSPNSVCALISMREAGYNRKGEWRDIAHNLAAALDCDPYDLFNDQQREVALERNSSEVYMSQAQVERITFGNPEESTWATIEARRLLECITDRERKIVKMRMEGLALAEVAEVEGVCVERVRQIECKAHRKMNTAASRQNRAFAQEMAWDAA